MLQGQISLDQNGWDQIIAGIKITLVSNKPESKRLGSNNCRDQNNFGIKFVGIKKFMGSKLRESSQLGSKKFWHQIGGIKKAGIKSAVSNHDTTDSIVRSPWRPSKLSQHIIKRQHEPMQGNLLVLLKYPMHTCLKKQVPTQFPYIGSPLVL